MISKRFLWFELYSLCTKKWNRFGQQHGLQSITLTTYFYKDIYQKLIYVNFCESIFQDKSIHMVFTFFKLNNLKVVHDLYSQCLTPILSKKTSFFSMEGVHYLYIHRQFKTVIYAVGAWTGGQVGLQTGHESRHSRKVS